MTRQLFSLCLASCLLASLPPARAEELPVRKAGLWEMKIVKADVGLPQMTMQHCTDETTEREMSAVFSPMSKEVCARQDLKKTATGYVGDYECTVGGVALTSHSEITGDFDSAFTVKSTSHRERGPNGQPHDATTVIEAKWLGACKPDQKPGDIVMPGGFKLNVKDAQKLKGLSPK